MFKLGRRQSSFTTLDHDTRVWSSRSNVTRRADVGRDVHEFGRIVLRGAALVFALACVTRAAAGGASGAWETVAGAASWLALLSLPSMVGGLSAIVVGRWLGRRYDGSEPAPALALWLTAIGLTLALSAVIAYVGLMILLWGLMAVLDLMGWQLSHEVDMDLWGIAIVVTWSSPTVGGLGAFLALVGLVWLGLTTPDRPIRP